MSDSRTRGGDGFGPRLVTAKSDTDSVCRCGTRLRGSGEHFEIEGLPPGLTPILGNKEFCSAPCVRAAFLEALSQLEALDTPEAETQVSDLREIYLQMASAYLAMLDQYFGEWGRVARDRTPRLAQS